MRAARRRRTAAIAMTSRLQLQRRRHRRRRRSWRRQRALQRCSLSPACRSAPLLRWLAPPQAAPRSRPKVSRPHRQQRQAMSGRTPATSRRLPPRWAALPASCRPMRRQAPPLRRAPSRRRRWLRATAVRMAAAAPPPQPPLTQLTDRPLGSLRWVRWQGWDDGGSIHQEQQQRRQGFLAACSTAVLLDPLPPATHQPPSRRRTGAASVAGAPTTSSTACPPPGASTRCQPSLFAALSPVRAVGRGWGLCACQPARHPPWRHDANQCTHTHLLPCRAPPGARQGGAPGRERSAGRQRRAARAAGQAAGDGGPVLGPLAGGARVGWVSGGCSARMMGHVWVCCKRYDCTGACSSSCPSPAAPPAAAALSAAAAKLGPHGQALAANAPSCAAPQPTSRRRRATMCVLLLFENCRTRR